MRIALVNSTRRWGGVKTWTIDLASWMAAHGHEPVIFARPGPFPDKARSLGLTAHELDFGADFSPRALKFFLGTFRQLAPRVVMVNVGRDLTTAGVAARLLKIPVVQRVGLPRDIAPKAKYRLLKNFIGQRYLCPCEYVRRGLLDELAYVGEGETAAFLTGKVPAEAPGPVHRPLRLVCTSQLNPDKGHADLLRALAEAASAGRDFRLEVYGEGSEADSLKALAWELGLTKRVDFHGFVADVPERLGQADALVLPSRSEGLPNTLLEAMARGLVPVARDVGGVGEIWPGELEGLLAKPVGTAGHADLAGPLDKLLGADDSEIAAMKQAALRTCAQRFNLETQAAAITGWLENLATTRPQ